MELSAFQEVLKEQAGTSFLSLHIHVPQTLPQGPLDRWWDKEGQTPVLPSRHLGAGL